MSRRKEFKRKHMKYNRGKSYYTVCKIDKILHTHSENQERRRASGGCLGD